MKKIAYNTGWEQAEKEQERPGVMYRFSPLQLLAKTLYRDQYQLGYDECHQNPL